MASTTHSQNLLKISEEAWLKLQPSERAQIQKKYLVEPVSSNLFGRVIDNQGMDKSVPGNNSGSVLGGSIAGAAYIDNAFRPNGNFSAKEHLAAVVIGGVLGSALNRAPVSQFKFRYAIQDGRGMVSYHDAVSQEPFRHPVGVCVLLPSVVLAPNQELCNQTPETLRIAYLSGSASILLERSSIENGGMKKDSPLEAAKPEVVGGELSIKVLCKIGALSPVAASREKCASINGEVIE